MYKVPSETLSTLKLLGAYSITRRSVCHVWDDIHVNFIWALNNEKLVLFWKDKWIPDIVIVPAYDLELTVFHYVIARNRDWDVLKQLSPNDILLYLDPLLPLQENQGEDYVL